MLFQQCRSLKKKKKKNVNLCEQRKISGKCLRPISFQIGLFQKKSSPPRRMGFWKFSPEGGSKTLEIQVGGGVEP